MMRRLASTAFVLLLLVAACGDDTAETTTTEPAPPPIDDAPEPTPEPTPPPWGMLYENATHGFSIRYPEEWSELEPFAPHHIVSFGPPDYDPSVTVAVDQRPEEPEEDVILADAAAGFLTEIPSYYPDFQLHSESKASLEDGTAAHEIVWSGSMEGYAFTAKYLLVVRGVQVFFVMGLSAPPTFDQNEAVIDRVLYSFRFEE